MAPSCCADNWTTDDSNPTYVSWSDLLLDPHPADCFRVRDADLEAKAHGYDNDKNAAPSTMSASDWDKLVSKLPVAVARKKRAKLTFMPEEFSEDGMQDSAPKLPCRFDGGL